MRDLIQIYNDKAVVSSRTVADRFKKRHTNVLRAIESVECSYRFTQLNFELSEYTDTTGRTLPEYLITRDGFTFLAMGFTGKEAALWKERFIEAFNAYETLSTSSTPSGPRFPSHMDDIARLLYADAFTAKEIKEITGVRPSTKYTPWRYVREPYSPFRAALALAEVIDRDYENRGELHMEMIARTLTVRINEMEMGLRRYKTV